MSSGPEIDDTIRFRAEQAAKLSTIVGACAIHRNAMLKKSPLLTEQLLRERDDKASQGYLYPFTSPFQSP